MGKNQRGFRVIVMAAVMLVWAAVGAASAADYSISYFKMQHRVYEDGSSFNRVMIYLKDENGDYVTTNVITDLKVTDPNGAELVLGAVTVDPPYTYRYVSYDGDKSSWGSNWKTIVWADTYADFTEPLTVGTYTLEITTTGGQVITDTHDFTGSIDLPAVKSATFDLETDANGGLVWEWDIPSDLYYLAAGLETSSRGYIMVRQGGVVTAMYSLKLPTHMGRVFLSKDMVDEITSKGDEYGFHVQVRTNDAINRSGTETVYVTSLSQTASGSDSVILGSDLSFTLPDLTYMPLVGSPVDLEAAFKFYGDQNGTLLWELESYSVK